MISIIAAVAKNGVIGKKNDLPWNLPEDLKRFRALTSGHAVIMGRKTWDSIFARVGGPLPKRRNIVITRQAHLDGALCAPSLEDAFKLVSPDEEAFVIGGAQIYGLALPYASRLYLTEIQATVEGDAFFPAWPRDCFREVTREHRTEPMAFDFAIYERIKTAT